MEIISWLNYVLYLEPPIDNRTKPKHIIGNQPPCVLINVQNRQSFHLTNEVLPRTIVVHAWFGGESKIVHQFWLHLCYHLLCKPTGRWYGPFLEVDGFLISYWSLWNVHCHVFQSIPLMLRFPGHTLYFFTIFTCWPFHCLYHGGINSM